MAAKLLKKDHRRQGTGLVAQLALFQKLRQLCHVPRYVPRLIAREQMALGLIFEIDVAQRLSIIVPHDKAAVLFFDTPG